MQPFRIQFAHPVENSNLIFPPIPIEPWGNAKLPSESVASAATDFHNRPRRGKMIFAPGKTRRTTAPENGREGNLIKR